MVQNLNNLAKNYLDQSRYVEAERTYKRLLVIQERVLDPEHPDVATSSENYAALLRKTRRGAKAAKMERRAKAIRAKYE